MNITPETLLKAANTAFPQYEWEIFGNEVARNLLAEDDQHDLRIVFAGGYYIKFDPVNNDSDWVALRESLEKLGFDIYWCAEKGVYQLDSWKFTVLPAIENANPRALAIDLCEKLPDNLAAVEAIE